MAKCMVGTPQEYILYKDVYKCAHCGDIQLMEIMTNKMDTNAVNADICWHKFSDEKPPEDTYCVARIPRGYNKIDGVLWEYVTCYFKRPCVYEPKKYAQGYWIWIHSNIHLRDENDVHPDTEWAQL